MPLEDADLAWIRTFVKWDPPDDTALADLYDGPDGGTREAVAVWYLRDRLFTLLADPASLSLPGGVSIGTAPNIAELSRMLQGLEADLPTDPADDPRAVTVLGLRRVGVDRG